MEKKDNNEFEEILQDTLENEFIRHLIYEFIKEAPSSARFAADKLGYERKKVFEKMFRASNVKNMSDPGSGLGLYYTKLLVKKLKGKIWFESKEGQGSVFYVTIPF